MVLQVWDNKILSDALIHERAVLFEIHTGSSHEVTIWGIIFDDYGDVIGLYIADNNYPGFNGIDAESVSTSYLQKYGVHYDDLNTPSYLTRLYYEPSNKFYKSNKLLEIITLYSSKDMVKKYVESNKHLINNQIFI